MTHHIYLVLTNSETLPSKIIRLYTRNEFNHILISMDASLETMYSFGRKTLYNPFHGGFVEEGIDSAFFRRFSKTTCEVFALPVSKKQHQLLQKQISAFIENQQELDYNYIGILYCMFNKNKERQNAYFCSQFVSLLLANADIISMEKQFIIPSHAQNIEGIQQVFKGQLADYPRATIEKSIG